MRKKVKKSMYCDWKKAVVTEDVCMNCIYYKEGWCVYHED